MPAVIRQAVRGERNRERVHGAQAEGDGVRAAALCGAEVRRPKPDAPEFDPNHERACTRCSLILARREARRPS